MSGGRPIRRRGLSIAGRGMQMSLRPEILVIDDGELDDVTGILRELAFEPVRLRGDASAAGWLWPARLLVTTARRGLTVGLPTPPVPDGCVSVAVLEDGSKTLVAVLRRLGFHYMIQRPVHPEALRLLLTGVLFGDREKRGETRVALGYEVRARSGWWRAPAVLAEISTAGCRLLTLRSLGRNSAIAIKIPPPLCGGRGLTLHGRVTRSDALGHGPKDSASLAVVFEGLGPDARHRLERMIEAFALGPPCAPGNPNRKLAEVASASSPLTMSPDTAAAEESVEIVPSVPGPLTVTPDSAAIEDLVEERHSDSADLDLEEDERGSPRAVFTQEVVSLHEQEGVRHVLVGRDLSRGGVSVEPHPSVALGDRLRVELYDPTSKRPLVVDAEVVWDRGDTGLGLRFVDTDPLVALQIELLVCAEVRALDVICEREGSTEQEPARRVESDHPGSRDVEEEANVAESPASGGDASDSDEQRPPWTVSPELSESEVELETDEQRTEWTLSPELSEGEAEELETRASAELRSPGNYVSVFLLADLRHGSPAVASGPSLGAPTDKRVPYEISLELTKEQRAQIVSLAAAEVRSVANYVAKRIIQELMNS